MEVSYAPLTVDDIGSIYANNYLTLIAFTLLIYEYLLTFSAEVERFWINFWRRPPWASTMFFANRYLTILGHIPILIEYFWYSLRPDKPKVNVGFVVLSAYFVLIVQLFVCALLVMRMYALYGQKKKVLGFLLALSVVFTTIACWAIVTGRENEAKTPSLDVLIARGCPTALSHALAMRMAVAWIGLLAFDTAVFGLTVYKTWSLGKTSLHGASLLNLLLRDGTIYFAVMICSNVANILTFAYGKTYTRGILTPFTNIISSTMMARLMLNLREFTAMPDQPLPGPNRNKQKDVLSQPVVFRMHGDRNPEMMSFEEEEEVKSDSEDGHLRVESTPWRENDAYRSQWYPTIFSSVASFATSRWERNRSQNSDAIELTDR